MKTSCCIKDLTEHRGGPYAARGQDERKRGTSPRHAVDAQLGAVALHDVLHDGQPQTGAAGVARAAAIDPVKASVVVWDKIAPKAKVRLTQVGEFPGQIEAE